VEMKREVSIRQLQREAYEKPRISEVQLRPDEAVLGNCKVSGSSGPVQASCDSPLACVTLGS
jgi:flagellar biosynthesis/type III secretory pathway protein FliH